MQWRSGLQEEVISVCWSPGVPNTRGEISSTCFRGFLMSTRDVPETRQNKPRNQENDARDQKIRRKCLCIELPVVFEGLVVLYRQGRNGNNFTRFQSCFSTTNLESSTFILAFYSFIPIIKINWLKSVFHTNSNLR